MIKKIAKGVVLFCLIALIPYRITAIILGYTAIMLLIQTILNSGKVEAPKLREILSTLKLVKTTPKGNVVARTPLPLLKKMIGWVVSDHLINSKASDFGKSFFEACKSAYEGGDESDTEEDDE